jgi:hypothetical protein
MLQRSTRLCAKIDLYQLWGVLMPKPFEVALSKSAAEGLIVGSWKSQTRIGDLPGRLSQPVLSDFESWHDAVLQRRAFAKRLKEN